MSKIYYIGYYSDPNETNGRQTAPAADTKMDYIISSLKKIGYDVVVLSFCEDDDRKKIIEKKRGYEIVKNGTKVVFFTNYTSKYRFIRVIGRLFTQMKIKKYLCDQCMDKNSKVLIYHSLGLMSVMKLFARKKKNFVLEMEEIYADVIGKPSIRKKEINVAQKASGYIFPTQMLNSTVNYVNKPYVIVHGTYQVEYERKKCIFKDSKERDSRRCIHCVYAGTFDPRKGGAAAAATMYLPSNYHMHILGFGTKRDIENMKEYIRDISNRSKAKISYEGLLTGEKYICFIQNCDIGLSTQNPEAVFNSTSFPSKILSYLANGLRVVSINIPAIVQSDVGDKLFYYDEQTPEQIAKAICSVNVEYEYDSRALIEQLSCKFEKELIDMLDRC